MVDSDRCGDIWHENTVSDIVRVKAAPAVTSMRFSGRQENKVGADWLWWWIDTTGECFGMLVQAKRLKHIGTRATIDFRYDNGEQMRSLFRTSDHFQVPAVYALYFGGVDHRHGLTCGARHTSPCPRCEKASVSVLSGQLAAEAGHDHRYLAESAFKWSCPLEDLADPAATTGPIRDVNLRLDNESLDPELRAFLLQGQTGARHAARMIFKAVSGVRAGQFSAAVADAIQLGSAAVFPQVPQDTGHFSRAYFADILRGLRTGVPDYVMDVLAGQVPPESVTDHVRGITVVHC